MNITTHNNYSPGTGYLGENTARVVTDSDPQNTRASTRQTEPQTPEPQTPEQQPLEKKGGENGSDSQLTQAELQLVTQLAQIDTEVRNHEMAHLAAGGSLITSGASFTYQRGPDGQNYAVAGEVGIDTSEIPGDPQATVQKMRQVKSAALAPASPSAQDLKVAAQAASLAAKASSELTMLLAEQQAQTHKTNEDKAFGNLKQASDSYTKVNNLPEKDTSTFKLAV